MIQSFFQEAGFNPHPWQSEEVANHALTPKRALFCSPRTGKTLGTLESLLKVISLLPNGAPYRILVVAPLTYVSDWADYLEKLGPCERLYQGNSNAAHEFIAKF